MKLKKINILNEIDKQILLTYFFKKTNTTLDKNELLTVSGIWYDSVQEKICANTKRFQEKLNPYKNTKISIENVDDTLKKILHDEFRIEEELIRCEVDNGTSIDYFYITVIGVDFFLIEKELKK